MTIPSFEPPTIPPHKALPPLPPLPPVRAAPPVVRQVEVDYYRRFVVSIGLSVLLNLLLLALVSSTGLSRLVRLSERPKPTTQRETPKLVLIPKPQPPPPTEPEFTKPKTFLETDPSQKSAEKPKNAEFYSEHDTVATQIAPSPIKPGDIPKADGQNTKSMATETVRPGPKVPPSPPPAPQVAPSPPAAPQTPPAPKASQPQPPSPPTPTPKTAPQAPLPPITKDGDFAFLRRDPLPKPQPRVEATQGTKPSEASPPQAPASPHAPSAPSPPSVPTTDREVLAAKSRLDGGVGRAGRLAFNSEESPFASYDKKVIAKIGANWNYLIEERFYGETVGQVMVSFKIVNDVEAHSARVSEVRIERNSANAVLAGYCVQAIEKSAPFGPFPESLRLIVGDSRDASVMFNY